MADSLRGVGLETSPEHPVPVRKVTQLMVEWIGRLGYVWVEGQVAQITRRPGQRTAFLTLRDPSADIPLSVTCSVALPDGPYGRNEGPGLKCAFAQVERGGTLS